MNEQEYQKQEDHWRELAEQLGLPSNGSESTTPPARPSQAPTTEEKGGSNRPERGDLDLGNVEASSEIKRKSSRKGASSPRGQTRRVETREEAEIPPSPPELEQASTPRGRGRPRARKREEPVFEQSSTEQGAKNQPEVVLTDPEKEEIDTLSDWNVPSWSEIIASLYRPER